MALRRTEQRHPKADGIDLLPDEDVLARLAESQLDAATSVRDALEPIARAAMLAAETIEKGGRLAYAAAGSSGLMALADALELPGTFGIAPERIAVLIAGGAAALHTLAGGPEDDGDEAGRAVREAGLGPADCLIAVTASGSTPYALAALEEARARGVRTIAIANNAGTPAFGLADIPIVLATPPEIVAGSTRMGAGTAQKIALNMLSTLMAIRLGHVHDGFMVNLKADNHKLQARATRIVATIAGCGEDEAGALLDRAGGSVKIATLLAAGAASRAAAEDLLEGSGWRLRPALSMLRGEAHARKHAT
ncbi:N-acetylmuramic acid 6-phosphate etherase [Nitratireductor sp. CAU 1489]|uniref:N-acetylmuramic acid 6-phosphate etherase n=1 Tax=Nitratireductor arenosus TaxID=2682096 RepID=A0A844QG94_9HYPH|nr:N-acetylmuramic acid 6-phosphate etherase [Nitratireductor arenosus]MVA96809.1 N-acetylmuramic acid 6-phosphate etherase [Nitratireductor arenosus]